MDWKMIIYIFVSIRLYIEWRNRVRYWVVKGMLCWFDLGIGLKLGNWKEILRIKLHYMMINIEI